MMSPASTNRFAETILLHHGGTMTSKIDRGLSILNATDETTNPYGLILSEKEREFIYAGLTRLDNMTNALLYGRTGWKPNLLATFETAMEFAGIAIVVFTLHRLLDVPTTPAFIGTVTFGVVQKLNLLLTNEKISDTLTRRQREDEKEAKERAKYLKDMGCEDLSLEK
jgi:hypothetical protein